MTFRRVVTGHSPTGKAIIVADQQVASTTAGGFSYDLMWAADAPLVVPNDASIPERPDFFPGEQGARVFTWIAHPDGAELPSATAEEFEAAAPGMAAHMEPDTPGMHTTQTVDVDIVLDGEIWMELDDGVEVRLGTGDVVVQNGTRHRWSNRSNRPTVVLSVILGASRGQL
jgi:mannose-6-phosphate isomerase-like protein (cupin superfamily)